MELRFEPGDVLAGKYRVDRVLAQGGMGVVVAATHLSLEQPVALKFMLPEVTSNADAVARFEREARTVARLRSEHVAKVHDVGELESGVPYIAMEYLQGEDLGTTLGRGTPIEFPDAVEYILQAAEALAEAHSLGIVHRDVKPENLFVTYRVDLTPLVKLLDFGISKVVTRSARDRAHTDTQEVMGSPAYMAPEQLVSTRDVDHRADIWGLGAILYELSCGRPAFEGESMVQLCARVLHEAHVPLAERCPEAPAGLSEVVDRCLEKDPTRRFASLAELARALEPYAPERARPVVDRILAMGLAAPVSDLPPGDDGYATDPRRRRDSDRVRHSDPMSRTAVSWGRRTTGERGTAWLLLALGAIGGAATVWWALSREPVADARVHDPAAAAAAPAFETIEPPPAAAVPGDPAAPAGATAAPAPAVATVGTAPAPSATSAATSAAAAPTASASAAAGASHPTTQAPRPSRAVGAAGAARKPAATADKTKEDVYSVRK